ncbi:MAG: hypothetical protein AAFN80_09665 [Pseudomonadota bacterium]
MSDERPHSGPIRRVDFSKPSSVLLRAIFVSPCVFWGVLGAFAMTAKSLLAAAICLALGWLIWAAWPGKYPSLFIALMMWLAFIVFVADLLAAWTAMWVGGLVAVILAFAVVAMAMRIGAPWGYDRAARLAAKGTPIREWEWVQIGAEFAVNHPLAQLRGGLLVIIGYVVAQWAFVLVNAILSDGYWLTWTIFAVFSVLSATTIYALGAFRPGARQLVWLHLVLWFPISLPLIVYWADGVRPNLIYARRFERLVPLENSGA